MNFKSAPKDQIRIVIVDVHAVLRESLTSLLSAQPDFIVAGQAASGEEALALVAEQQADVVLLHLLVAEGDGFEILRTLDRARIFTVVLTGSDSDVDYAQVVRLGARGMVLKSDSPEQLFTAIRTVAGGELAFSEELTQQVLTAMTAESRNLHNNMERLSTRERQIAYHVTRGMKNRDIGTALSISENTVKRHLQSIFTKTGARDRLELAMLALREVGKAA